MAVMLPGERRASQPAVPDVSGRNRRQHLVPASRLDALQRNRLLVRRHQSVGHGDARLFAWPSARHICKSFPLQPFFFFFSTDYIIPQTFTVTSSIGCFYFLVFLFYNF